MSRKSKMKMKRKMIWFILTSMFAFSVFCLTMQRSISGLCFLFSIFHTKISFLGWQSYTYFYMYTNLVGNRTCDSTKYIPFENFSISKTVFFTEFSIHFEVIFLSDISPFNLCSTNIPLLNPWKHKKPGGFLMFLGSIEVEHWLKLGWIGFTMRIINILICWWLVYL